MCLNLSLARFILQGNFASIISLLLLISLIITNATLSKKRNRKFIILCFSTFLLTVSDNIRFITFQLEQPNIWRYLSAAGGYSLRPFIIFLFLYIVNEEKSLKTFLISIPIYINFFLAFASCIPQFHGLMFSYSPDNNFIRGMFGFFPYFVSLFYIINIIINLINRKYINILEIFVVFFIIFLGCFATFLESIYKYDLILSQSMVIGSVFYYIFLNIQLYKRDSLTYLENRRCFYLHIEKLKNDDFVLISMDLNNLKSINDTLGHSAGDDAIITSVKYMHKYFSKLGSLYRTGGDEFMCIIKKYSIEKINSKISIFQEELKEKNLQVACGTAQYHAGDDIDTIISNSDKSMYKNKKLLKEKNKQTLVSK